MTNHVRNPLGKATVCLAAALILVAACSSSTDPGGGGGEVEITYSPTAADIAMIVGRTLELRATVTGADQVAVAWSVGGAQVATGPVYVHAAAAVGADTIAVAVTADGRSYGRTWRLTINPDDSQLPPAVAGATLAHGPAPAQVVVSWLRTVATHFPIVDYLVACSFDGPVTTANWDAALQLGAFAHEPGSLYQTPRTFGEGEGMIPGAPVWFAVRARDDRGQLSPIDAILSLTVTYAWTLNVLVRDDAGLPLQNVILNHGTGDPVTTDAAGRTAIGPLRSIDAVAVATNSPHFDYTTEPLAATADTLKIVLLRRYDPDHVLCGTVVYADFLDYVRRITLTDGGGDGATVLHKWDHYPLSVWIPPYTSAALGWDMQALSAAAVPIWNGVLGEDYLVAAADSLAADIVFAFRDLPGDYKGLTRVLLPGGNLGEFIPEKMELAIESILDTNPDPQPIWVTEIALHELGHALGHYGHTCLTGQGNLMDSGGATGSLDNGPENAINLDELHLVRAVRHLPQGVDMAGYDGR